MDQSSWKLHELELNAPGQEPLNIVTIAGDAMELQPQQPRSFDRVLWDAPCSFFGTIWRNPDIKWQGHPKDPYRFSQPQRRLFAHASVFTKPDENLVTLPSHISLRKTLRLQIIFAAATKAGAWSWWLIFFSASCREMVQGRIFQITAVYSRGGRVSRHSLAQNKLTSSFILALQLPASTRPLLVRGYQARIVSILPTQRPVKPAQKGLLRVRTSGKMPDFAGFRNMIQRQIFGDETSNQYGYNMAKKGFPNRTSYLCICPLPV